MPIKPNPMILMNDLLEMVNQFIPTSKNMHSVIFDSLYLLNDLNKHKLHTEQIGHTLKDKVSNADSNPVVSSLDRQSKSTLQKPSHSNVHSSTSSNESIEMKIKSNIQEFGIALVESTTGTIFTHFYFHSLLLLFYKYSKHFYYYYLCSEMVMFPRLPTRRCNLESVGAIFNQSTATSTYVLIMTIN